MIQVRTTHGRVLLPLRVSPGASRTAVGAEHAGRLRVYVSAPPEAGKANEALRETLAEALGLRRSDIDIVSGLAGRDKEAAVSSIDAPALAARLRAMGLDAQPGK